MSDNVLWHTCQQEDLILITINRNAQDPTSLEATIRRENQVDSMPVLTIANPDRILSDHSYAEQAADRLVEVLVDLDDARGSGRLWLP